MMTKDKHRNDYTKFSCFVKGVLVTAEVIKRSERPLTQLAKMHFNQVLAACTKFEKYLHKEIGEQIANDEDEINGSIVGLVWNLFEMSPEEREQFIDYINEFEFKPAEKSEN